jgi:hypothetical protein
VPGRRAGHRVFSRVKRVLLDTYQGAVSPEHLQAYLDQYVFRFNRRSSTNRFTLVQRLLERAFTSARSDSQLVGQAVVV